MGAGRISAYQLGSWMDQLQATELFGTLFTADPNGSTDPLAVEVIGSGYNRVQASFTRTGAALMTLDEPLAILAIPPGTTVVWIGFMDAPTNGHLIASDLVRDPSTGATTPQSYPTGGTFVVPATEFVIGVDVPGM